jgi:hypothetical protein
MESMEFKGVLKKRYGLAMDILLNARLIAKGKSAPVIFSLISLFI